MNRCLGTACAAWIVGLSVAACGGESFSAERSLSGTVAVERARQLVVDSVLPVIVQGQTRSDIGYEVDAVITASAADTAERIARQIAIGVRREQAGASVVVTLAPPQMGTIDGQMTVSTPRDLDLRGLIRAGTLDVVRVDGDLNLEAVSSVRVIEPGGDVTIGTQSGNAIVISALPPGTATEVVALAGDIQLTLPNRVSAAIQATAGQEIAVAHPGLPAHLGGALGYAVNVNGGLATVRLTAMRGNVVITNN